MVKREISLLKRLDHENIVKLHDHYEDGQNFYLVFDLLKGGDLYNDLIQRKRRK